MLSVHPDDFDRESGKRKILSFLHEVDVKIKRLEKEVEDLKRWQKREGKEIASTN